MKECFIYKILIFPCHNLSSLAIWKEKSQFIMVHLDVHQVHAASLKLSEIVCYLSEGNEMCVHAKMCSSTFGLLWLLRKEEADLPHSMVVQLDVMSDHAASLK